MDMDLDGTLQRGSRRRVFRHFDRARKSRDSSQAPTDDGGCPSRKNGRKLHGLTSVNSRRIMLEVTRVEQ